MTKSGLSSQEAKQRLEKFGYNMIEADKGKHPLKILLVQFNSLMVYLLVIVAGLSFWFQEYLDATAIALVILINALPADKKWYRNFAVAKIITEHLESLKLKYPKS